MIGYDIENPSGMIEINGDEIIYGDETVAYKVDIVDFKAGDDMAVSDTASLILPGPPKPGQYSLKVSNGNEEDILKGAVTFGETPPERRKAIIIAGGGDPSDDLWNATVTCANEAYLALLSQGYVADTIYYLNSVSETDADGDGKKDVDAEATLENLEYAINTWIRHPENPENTTDELVIYMVGNGGIDDSGDSGYFEMNTVTTTDENKGRLYATKLAQWLNDLQPDAGSKEPDPEPSVTPKKIVVVYDADRSESFLSSETLSVPKNGERYFITSSSENERAWFLENGTFSFSYHFWDFVESNGYLCKAFIHARDMMETDQIAQIDTNTDGEADEIYERGIGENNTIITINGNEMEENIPIGRGRVVTCVAPEIEVCEDDGFLKITGHDLKQLEDEGISQETISQLGSLKNRAYKNSEQFKSDLKETVGELTDELSSMILELAKKAEPMIQVGDTMAFCTKIVSDASDVGKIVARITLPESSQVTFRPAEELESDEDNVIYTGKYEKFIRPGKYTISFQAAHIKDECPPSEVKTITVNCLLKGDISRNDRIDLADAVLALRMTAATDPIEIENPSEIDVNGDGEIGLAELIYILKELTQM
ncbi:hypothetical protein [Desulfonema magnum]|uniref:Dockerin domain-containing protein n=1 Tax=Desulfonema magnum TaxID=45655 RepID=A0A975BK31_9BACT|nr:hypothetical protein [Desulfonema magnum]QTA86941.1 dockerin domain-containing protein [Desulfonema magnum]